MIHKGISKEMYKMKKKKKEKGQENVSCSSLMTLSHPKPVVHIFQRLSQQIVTK
jgi:hypothetical protein